MTTTPLKSFRLYYTRVAERQRDPLYLPTIRSTVIHASTLQDAIAQLHAMPGIQIDPVRVGSFVEE